MKRTKVQAKEYLRKRKDSKIIWFSLVIEFKYSNLRKDYIK